MDSWDLRMGPHVQAGHCRTARVEMRPLKGPRLVCVCVCVVEGGGPHEGKFGHRHMAEKVMRWQRWGDTAMRHPGCNPRS